MSTNTERMRLCRGAKYPSIEAVKDVVKLWAISLRKEFRVVKSSSKKYEVKCVNGDCTWRVHAYKGKYKTHCECSIVTPHTCRLTVVAQTHRKITSTFVAKKMYGAILDKIDYEPKLIIRDIDDRFQYKISYAKDRFHARTGQGRVSADKGSFRIA